jgi:hypothetical protein
VFVHYSTIVPIGISEVERRIDAVRAHLEEWADTAYRSGEELRARVGPGGGIAKSVELQLGIAAVHRRGLVYPVRWTANGSGLIFPELRADLVLSQMGSVQTALTLDGTYDPPFGPVGRILDRAILGRVAEATVRNWVDRLAEAVSSREAQEA